MTKVAAIQIEPSLSSDDETIRKSLELIKRAAELGVEVACFPEQWLMNPMIAHKKLIDCLSSSAKKFKMHIISGANYEKIDNEIFISSQVFDPSGNIIARQFKIHLFKDEKKIAVPGRNYDIFEIKDFKAGIMICYDAVFPEVARILTLKGADIIFVPSRIRKKGIVPWHLYLKVRSLENRVAIVGTNITNTPKYPGQSIILMPEIIRDLEDILVYPKVIDKGDSLQQVIVAELDMNSIRGIRNQRINDRMPETYRSIAE